MLWVSDQEKMSIDFPFTQEHWSGTSLLPLNTALISHCSALGFEEKWCCERTRSWRLGGWRDSLLHQQLQKYIQSGVWEVLSHTRCLVWLNRTLVRLTLSCICLTSWFRQDEKAVGNLMCNLEEKKVTQEHVLCKFRCVLIAMISILMRWCVCQKCWEMTFGLMDTFFCTQSL